MLCYCGRGLPDVGLYDARETTCHYCGMAYRLVGKDVRAVEPAGRKRVDDLEAWVARVERELAELRGRLGEA